MKKNLILKLLIVVVGVALILGWCFREKLDLNISSPDKFNCTEQKATDFDCYRNYYSSLVENRGTTAAFADLKIRYEKSSYVSSQCHQMVHVIGFEATKKYKTVAEAYTKGDSFCWSGYYHGVLEGVIGDIGYDGLVEGINEICKPLAEERKYSFDHYNCAHGIGHGVMAAVDNALFESLKTCDLLTDAWERTSCWSGAFMENVMVDNRYHTSKYLKPKDPFYPCNAVGEQYKNTCYLMQTSYVLTVVDGGYAEVFDLCSNIEVNHRNTCYQSLGRDISGQSVSDVQKTKTSCNLGKEYIQRENCIIGAVKDFISYLHSDTRAKELCSVLEEKDLQNVCYATTKSYYKNL